MINLRLAACAAIVFGLTASAHAAGNVSAAEFETWCRTTPAGQMSRNDIMLCEANEHLTRSLERYIAKQELAEKAERDRIAEDARKSRARVASGYRDPGATDICPAPHYRMTERDGCQPARR